MALCDQADVEALRQIDFTLDPDPRVTKLIELAQGQIEGLTGRAFDAITDEVIAAEDLEERDGTLYVETYPITAISIDSQGATLVEGTDYHLNPFGVVTRLGAGTGVYTWDWQYNTSGRPSWLVGDTLTVSGGFDDPDADGVPKDLRLLCAQIAAYLFDRGAPSGSGAAGVLQETLSGWTVTYSLTERDLTPAQLKTVRKYRHNIPVVAV